MGERVEPSSQRAGANSIYHMLELSMWTAQPDAPYAAASLASEGFIHLTGERDLLLRVANAVYRDEPGDWQILVVDPARLQAPLRWEQVGDSLFPHLYGPLNRDAVIEVIDFPRAADGSYTLPVAWREPGN